MSPTADELELAAIEGRAAGTALAAAFARQARTTLRGDQGPQGERGPEGPSGPRGEQGETGPAGAPGRRGDPGETGAEGPAGRDGRAGADGAAGPRGATGTRGPAGPAGEDGRTVLSGRGAPDSRLGQDGDFYVDLDRYLLYGPRTHTVWGAGSSLIGPRGPSGIQGQQGPPGPPGSGGGEGGAVDSVNGLTGEVVLGLTDVLGEGNDANALAIVNLADPTDPQDAATKAYVDAATPAAPTLADVLAEGNDPGGQTIHGADNGQNLGASILVSPGTVSGGGVVIEAGQGGIGAVGGAVEIRGGRGSNGATVPASIVLGWGDDEDVTPGRIQIVTEDSNGATGDVLTAQGDGTALWAAPDASAGTPPLADVLAEDNDADGLGITNLLGITGVPTPGGTLSITGPDAAGTGVSVVVDGGDDTDSGSQGAHFVVGSGTGGSGGGFVAAAGNGASTGGSVTFQAGGTVPSGSAGDVHLTAGSDDENAGAEIHALGGTGASGRVKVKTGGSTGSAGEVLTAQGDGTALWGVPGGVVPVGGIIMWSGAIADITAPWALCDGTANAPGPDLRNTFVVGAQEDEGGVAKTNIEGSLKVSATQTGATLASHDALTHAGGAVGDHTGLTHDGAVASHPDLTHAALSHAALTVTHPDHSVASGSHTHASGADVSIPSGLGSQPSVSHTHPSIANASAPSGTFASGVDVSIASITGASAAGVSSFATSTNRSGLTALPSHSHAAATASRPSGSIASTAGVSVPSLSGTVASAADVSVPAATGSRPSLTGSQAAVTLTHADHSLASMSHQAIGTHANLTHGFTPPAAHGAAGTLTHAFTQPDVHSISAHGTVPIVPRYYALAFIQRLAA